MFDKDQSILFAYPAARPGAAYVVPATVQGIAPAAFRFGGGWSVHESHVSLFPGR